MYDVKLTVKSVKDYCSAGYKPGDYFLLKDGIMLEAGKPQGICLYALAALIPYLTAFSRKTDPNDWINGIQELQCPDSNNTVIFAVERVGGKE